MEIICDKVTLRPADDSDVDDLHDWWNDPGFAGDYAGFFPKTRDEVKELLREAHNFIIEAKSDRRKIGFASYYLIRTDYENLYEIGYRIKAEERNKGYTSEAARLLVAYMFRTLDIERIESITDVENIPSQKVLEKTGFKREGRLRKRFYLGGEYRDEYMYGLLREEWKGTEAG